jgi:hypothetical protein
MTPALAVGLSGRIGSGKTSLATALAERLQCPRASFGDYVRSVAAGRGLDAEDRQVLQDLGDEMIATQGWTPFCRSVLDHAGYGGGSLVVDGIRHAEAAGTMRALVAPMPWRSVAVDSENEVRLFRLAARGVVGACAHTADAHPNETQVGAVMDSADFVVSGDSTVGDAVNAVMAWLDNS